MDTMDLIVQLVVKEATNQPWGLWNALNAPPILMIQLVMV
jgi:hypothetical protein